MGLVKIPNESKEYFLNNISSILDNGLLSEGYWINKNEDFIKNLTNCNTVLTNSNGAGIFVILQYLKHKYPNLDYVCYIQDNTMYGVYTIANTAGYKVKYVKSNVDNYLMPDISNIKNSKELENDMLDKNKLVVVLLSHLGGVCNPDIKNIKNYLDTGINTFLVEDCAHSFGVKYDENTYTGSIGLAGVYSFYATKSIPCGESGAIITKDKDVYEFSKRFIMYDRLKMEYPVGINLRVSEIQALFNFSVLKEYENILKFKKVIYDLYNSILDKYISDDFYPIKNINNNYYKYTIIDKKGILKDYFKNNPSCMTSRIYDYDLPNSSNVCKDVHWCLPIWYKYDLKLLDNVKYTLTEYLKNYFGY